jgi:hypothetical protein
MGFLDFLFGRKGPPIQDAGQLQQALFQAAQAGDQRRLERLCRANRDAGLANFPGWQKVPPQLRDDPEALQGYLPSSGPGGTRTHIVPLKRRVLSQLSYKASQCVGQESNLHSDCGWVTATWARQCPADTTVSTTYGSRTRLPRLRAGDTSPEVERRIRNSQQGWKESNPLCPVWRRTALPGAHPCLSLPDAVPHTVMYGAGGRL